MSSRCMIYFSWCCFLSACGHLLINKRLILVNAAIKIIAPYPNSFQTSVPIIKPWNHELFPKNTIGSLIIPSAIKPELMIPLPSRRSLKIIANTTQERKWGKKQIVWIVFLNNLLLLSRENEGIGLKNIHDRLQLCYGSDYGITISSEKNVGTTVYVRLADQIQSDHKSWHPLDMSSTVDFILRLYFYTRESHKIQQKRNPITRIPSLILSISLYLQNCTQTFHLKPITISYPDLLVKPSTD